MNQSMNQITKQLIASLILQAACAVVGVQGLQTDCVEMPGVPLGTEVALGMPVTPWDSSVWRIE